MAEIENLSISISANAAEAIAEINKLASALSKFSGASNSAGNSAGRTADKVQDLGTATAQEAEETGEAAAATKTFGERLKAAGINVDAIKDRFKSLTGRVGSFFSMIKRVATYRAIRAALRMITDGFKEGIKNFYDYSKAIDGKFAKSMDSLSSSVLYLRNSLGTLAAPVIEALAPVFNTIVNVIVDAINAFNMFIAAVSGSSTYTAAVRVSSEWGNAAEQMANDVDNIESTAKRIKSTILGFDEINPLKAENTGGGGGGGYGGGSGGGGGAGIMFEERPLEGFLRTISDITSGLPDWLKWLLGGTALVGGFLLIKNFIPWLIKKLGELFALKIPDWLHWLLNGGGSGEGDDGNRDITVDLNRGDWSALDELENKVVDVKTNVTKGSWDNDAWAAANMTSYSPTRTVKAVVQKGDWDNEAWNAANMTPYSPTRTVNSTVKKGDWNNDAWLAANMTSYSATRNVTSNVAQGEWDSTAWLAASMTSNSARRNITVNVKKGAWNDTAWTAATMTSFSPVRTVTAKVVKGAWDDTAWLAANMTSYGATRTVTAKVSKGDWNNDAWSAANMGGSTIARLINVAVAKASTWNNDAWSAANMGGTTTSMSLNVNIKLNQTAKALFKAFKKAWNDSKTSLRLTVKLDVTAKSIFKAFRKSWNESKTSLFLSPKLDNTADNLFNAIKNRWNNKKTPLYLSPKLDNTADALWNSFKHDWDSKDRIVYVKIKAKNDTGISGASGGGGGTSGGGAGSGRRGFESLLPNQTINYSKLELATNMAMPYNGESYYAQKWENTDSSENDMLADMIRKGVEEAMARERELLRQQNEYLRQINEKEFSADVSTSAINRANSRMNRRAGITVAPVGAM